MTEENTKLQKRAIEHIEPYATRHAEAGCVKITDRDETGLKAALG